MMAMDILSMLKSAQSDFNSRQQTNVSNNSNNSVASFFTSCGAKTSSSSSTMPIQIQKMTLESIEKAVIKSSPPNRESLI